MPIVIERFNLYKAHNLPQNQSLLQQRRASEIKTYRARRLKPKARQTISFGVKCRGFRSKIAKYPLVATISERLAAGESNQRRILSARTTRLFIYKDVWLLTDHLLSSLYVLINSKWVFIIAFQVENVIWFGNASRKSVSCYFTKCSHNFCISENSFCLVCHTHLYIIQNLSIVEWAFNLGLWSAASL